ncbi:hypothetical protein SEPCBS57363_000817 [Sporothrix epigloea]|uniref:Uncharacterized protein n=1 Tax=Sporothrix epigloea TaxID=1892477 RepID=A0ABP0D6T3_9PEZI
MKPTRPRIKWIKKIEPSKPRIIIKIKNHETLSASAIATSRVPLPKVKKSTKRQTYKTSILPYDPCYSSPETLSDAAEKESSIKVAIAEYATAQDRASKVAMMNAEKEEASKVHGYDARDIEAAEILIAMSRGEYCNNMCLSDQQVQI